jgi:integration host factor subunit alpha
MPPLFDTSRIRMNPRDETAEMAHGLNFHEGLPSQAAHVGQPAFIRAHLIERLTARLGLDKSDAHALLDAFFELIMQALENGEAVRLSGCGCFHLRDRRVALRHLGTARTGAYFSVAPLFGVALSLLIWPELPRVSFWIAAALMALGIWLHIREKARASTHA